MMPYSIDSVQSSGHSRAAATVGCRIHVMGTAGSGKTTLAARLARLFNLRHLELDRIYWGPGAQPVQDSVFIHAVNAHVAGDAWVVDGNYLRFTRRLIWPHADTAVWLDLPRPLLIWRLLQRTLARERRGIEWSAGNRESLRRLLWWAWTSHTRRSAELEEGLAQSKMTVIRLRSPTEVATWLESLASRPRSSVSRRREC